MPQFADITVSSFLDALASPDPTPGGGTASAVAGAMGVSLLMMVAGLPKSRSNADAEIAALSEARASLMSVHQRILALADTDSEAYNQVVTAYRLPKTTDEEKAARKQAVQRALRAATDAPLDTVRAAAEAMKLARLVAQHGNRSATSDVRVALELLEAAAAGATANVETNLTSLDDESYRTATASTVIDVTNTLTEDAAACRTLLA